MATFQNLGSAAKPNNAVYFTGKQLVTIPAQLFVDISEVADDDVWILGAVDINARVHRILVGKAFDLAAAANNDIGFYKKNADGTYTAIDGDILVDGADWTSGSGLIAGYDLLTANTSLDRTKSVGELLSLNADSGYSQLYVGIQMKTKETTADVTLDLDLIVEQATTL